MTEGILIFKIAALFPGFWKINLKFAPIISYWHYYVKLAKER